MNEIIGQIKIGRLTERQTAAVNAWLGVRHFKHSPYAIERLKLSKEENTLFGEFGVDGEFVIPNISKCVEQGRGVTSFAIRTSEEFLSHEKRCIEAEGGKANDLLIKWPDMDTGNTPPSECPELWLDFVVFSPEGEDYSILAGNETDTYCDEDSIRYIGSVLEKLGSKLIEGTIGIHSFEDDNEEDEEYEDGEVSIVKICGNNIVVDSIIPVQEFEEEMVTTFVENPNI